MYPFWNQVIAPLIEAAQARRVVEIGALQGETTVHLLEALGPEAELHVIDPLPQFDPSEHEQRFPGRYHFHREISHDVLPKLGAVDAALIDGDHNWYTVYNELKMLDAAAREEQAPLPILFLHDVGWPYGRRDLYYAPEQIPEEFRQPYARKGLQLRRGRRRRTDLLERGGFNSRMNNATTEGGPRNGVMTALEDFIEEGDRDLRLLVLPFYFSLAIVIEEDRIVDRPELETALARFEDPAFLREMLELSERLRLKEMHWGQVVFYHWQDRLEEAARRYLDLLSAKLEGPMAGAELLRDCLEMIRRENVKGDFVHWGITGSDAAVFARGFAQAHGMKDRAICVVSDRAAGDPFADLRGRLEEFELLDEQVRLLPSAPTDGSDLEQVESVALLVIGAEAAVREGLIALYDRISLGGAVIVAGCTDSQRRSKVESFNEERGGEELDQSRSGDALSWRKLL